ncbi:hypothetical protein [Hirschia litorea]|uniref:Uncharacterized protein n=1 Tax=Hirschia litorea TaxID=1199156 RepID=A0ABW2IPZ9_9PROT
MFKQFSILGVVLLYVFGIAAHAQQIAVSERNNLKYACEATWEISGVEVDARWCQCKNDYYLDHMTVSDWLKYSRDYYALNKLEGIQSEANSYTRYLQLADSHCRTCKEDNYKGCIKGETQIDKYKDLAENISTGQFQNVRKDMMYKAFFADFIKGYSDHCSAYIREGMVETHIYEDPVLGTGGYRREIEMTFFNSYIQYSKDLANNFMLEIIGKAYKSVMEQNPMAMMEIGFDIATRDAFMSQHLAGKCQTPRVRALHTNLALFDRGLPAQIDPRVVKKELASTREKRNEIYAYTQKSYEKAVAEYAPIRDKYEPKSCPRQQDEATYISTPRSPDGYNLKDLEGSWRGTLFGEPAEMGLWHIQHTPESTPTAIGVLYLAERKCTLGLGFDVYGNPARATISTYHMHRQPLNCMDVMQGDYDKGGFTVWGDFAVQNGKPTFLFSQIDYFLKDVADCDGPSPSFERAKASDAFKQAMRDILAANDPNVFPPTQEQVEKIIH